MVPAEGTLLSVPWLLSWSGQGFHRPSLPWEPKQDELFSYNLGPLGIIGE